MPCPYRRNPPAFEIKPLLVSLAHGEGFTGQGAVAHDGPEQVVFGQGRQQETDRVGTGPQTFDGGGAMDVVDMPVSPFGEVGVEELLQGGHRQRQMRAGHGQQTVPATGDERDGMAPRRGLGLDVAGRRGIGPPVDPARRAGGGKMRLGAGQ